ncbi:MULTISPECIES: DUF3397 family protein [Oceanobacillus]|uniref:DUF3397 domain-containing protein n=1 Tax=Oceanobacillus kimchii TaxID=746691 RepID=A0ABQ5THZ1_9BACI|nr:MULTISPECIES: DUF3397 family protein [Oceanobacillus]MBT2598808.1 DUF3397 family protein [Oceanobacillus sp. ISL-74]MBT2651727.1 DUF3397 family protein [Oceanobacillus sp. ISL-73]MCT1576376.1 DUF3397 domain-containing protein [Oceanobacillus kimchii]MCT2136012.1 DUF3397 domain-containing protein [Oceanobacillus kimchii]OEH54566.1 hypothetical protein AQ616_12465 [Oceanobacillus sp. E9]
MKDILIYTFATAISFPFIVTIGIYWISKWTRSSNWKAIHVAVHWSTLFYIIAVSIILNLLLQQSFIGFILLFFLIFLMLIIIYQRKKQTDVELLKAFRIVWRGAFLLFFTLYFLLGCIYIVNGVWGG